MTSLSDAGVHLGATRTASRPEGPVAIDIDDDDEQRLFPDVAGEHALPRQRGLTFRDWQWRIRTHRRSVLQFDLEEELVA